MKPILLFGALALICSAVSGRAHAETSADEWQFQLTPYLWLPTIDGTLNYGAPPGGGGGPISIPVSVDLNLNTLTDMDGLLWTLAAGYTVKQTETSSVDIFAGAREVGDAWQVRV